MKKSIKSKSSRKSQPKRRIAEKEKRALEKTMARGIFEEAKRAERFGPHPGYVDIKIRISLYNAMNQRETRLPGKDLQLLVSSVEEVDDLIRLMEKMIRMWIGGKIAL